MLPKKPTSKGQILLSILISIAVFAILTHAIFTLLASSFSLVAFNKARITARHLAQEKIEIIRNLSYSDVGTQGGIPSGVLLQEENIVRNGLNYKVKIDVVYFDDPFNGTGPPDDIDYKRARVEVSWEGLAASKKNPVILITDVSSSATTNIDAGTLIVLVVDANGNPVPQAEVSIIAPTNPPVNLTQQTDSDGKVLLPGAPPCVSCYEISVTKAGYSSDRTYSTSEVANPLKPHTSVFLEDVTQVSFAIDRVGTLNIASVNSRENNFTPLGNIAFRLRGNKIIGTDAFAQLVYKYDENLLTGGSGTLSLPNMEWDVYQVLMSTAPSYDISGTSPLLPLYLTPAGSVDFTFAVSPHTAHSFFITVKDPSQNLIASASANLADGGGFNQTKFTGDTTNPDFGQALFSALSEDTFTLTATASGFLNYTGTYDVSGYTQAVINLTPQ